jgi:hypothetical protein
MLAGVHRASSKSYAASRRISRELRAPRYRSICLLANYSNIVGQSGYVLKAALLMHNNFCLIPAGS